MSTDASAGDHGTRPLIEAVGLSKTYEAGGLFIRRRSIQAVKSVDARVARGEAVGVVGESGSGKSTLGRLMLGLIEPSEGTVRFDDLPMTDSSGPAWRAMRKRMQIVFQDPYGSLDPRRRVGSQIADGMAIHRLAPAPDVKERVGALLERVGLDRSHANRFPHEFSGGQRQRVGIARALASEPAFLVADEPVSALDVSIQAQIIRLLADLRRDLGLAMLFISHDLPVVRHLCDRVIVMYLGRVMEEGPAETVFASPAHPYTRALVSATPRLHQGQRVKRILLSGDPPSPSSPPSGCVFRTRCVHALKACAETVPELEPVIPATTSSVPTHRVACIRAHEIN